MEKSCKKYLPKASLRSLFNFGQKPKTAIHCMQEIILKIRYFERGLSKRPLKS